uniref:Annexin n=1 Tax=Caenorhabditis tropicalis TaxID=1561998 RepID=A0A1I7V1Z2_9PELO
MVDMRQALLKDLSSTEIAFSPNFFYPISCSSQTLSTGSSIDSENSHRSKNIPMIFQMYESQYEDLRGTIYGPSSPDFHPVQASETLRSSLHGLETKDQTIINTVLYHNNFQRQKILGAYEDMYSRKLLEDLEEECGGFFFEMCQSLFKAAPNYDAQCVYKSLSNRHGDRSVAIEIACTRSPRQLRALRDTYQTDYRKALEKDIVVKVEGVVGKMLTLLLCNNREEGLGVRVNDELVDKHVKILMSNTIDDIAKNVNLFEELFIGHSWKHIGAVLDKVDEARRDMQDVETMIRRNKNIHSEIRLILLTIVRVSRNIQIYFAEKLRAAMTAERVDQSTIIRICVSRSEIDLQDISLEYKRKYHRPLEHDICQSTSGEYTRMICTLLNGFNNIENSLAPTPESIE